MTNISIQIIQQEILNRDSLINAAKEKIKVLSEEIETYKEDKTNLYHTLTLLESNPVIISDKKLRKKALDEMEGNITYTQLMDWLKSKGKDFVFTKQMIAKEFFAHAKPESTKIVKAKIESVLGYAKSTSCTIEKTDDIEGMAAFRIKASFNNETLTESQNNTTSEREQRSPHN